MVAVNVAGTSALLGACARAGVRRVIYTGTIGTVGRPPMTDALPDEDTPFNLWNGASHYVRSKYLGELVARGWSEAGLNVVLVKPAAPVGAGDARPTATGTRILAALEGRATPYPPGGINYAPVQDIALGHILAAERGLPGRAYILGHRDGNLNEAAFQKMIAQVAHTRTIRLASQRAGAGQLPAALTANPSRAIRELGLPQSDLVAAFAEAVAWYQAQKG
jgi:dihydroflavonol-4-reductase